MNTKHFNISKKNNYEFFWNIILIKKAYKVIKLAIIHHETLFLRKILFIHVDGLMNIDPVFLIRPHIIFFNYDKGKEIFINEKAKH